MFLGKAQAPAEAPAAPVVPPRRQKVAAKDAKIFQPSNFASRKAEAEANNATRSRRRLVSLGQSEFMERKANDVKVIDVELFVNIDRPAEMFVQWPGHPDMHPMQSDDRRDPAPVKLPPITRRARFAGAFNPSLPAPPPRPV